MLYSAERENKQESKEKREEKVKQLKKDLQAVTKEHKKLAQKIDKIIKQLERFEKAQRTKDLRAKKLKKVPEVDPILAHAIRRKIFPSDIVLAHIIANRDGIDLATLEKKTGFKDFSIKNIIHRLRKQGKITSKRKEGLRGEEYGLGKSRTLYFEV
jgi:predicted RNase H-like nuclease (RuvC/YqgF family)